MNGGRRRRHGERQRFKTEDAPQRVIGAKAAAAADKREMPKYRNIGTVACNATPGRTCIFAMRRTFSRAHAYRHLYADDCSVNSISEFNFGPSIVFFLMLSRIECSDVVKTRSPCVDNSKEPRLSPLRRSHRIERKVIVSLSLLKKSVRLQLTRNELAWMCIRRDEQRRMEKKVLLIRIVVDVRRNVSSLTADNEGAPKRGDIRSGSTGHRRAKSDGEQPLGLRQRRFFLV